MVSWLIRKLVPNYKEAKQPKQAEARRKIGSICGACGIFFNLLLFAGKLIMGLITHSIAIVGDALNNLSDAGSSIITMFGFRMAGKAPDADHPFGHGRVEYLSGLVVAMLIILMGFELFKSSFEKIRSPEPITFSWVAVAVLVAAILVKLYMSAYNRRIGKKINSTAMAATAVDSLSDCIATGAVLLATLIGGLADWNIDGYAGLIVACFILFAGYNAAKDTLAPLLGQPPEPEFVHEIESIVLGYHNIVGIHDLIVHDYGPGRLMVTLHAEVPARMDVLALHDEIDCAEEELRRTLNCEATIHMDPIVTGDPRVAELRAEVAAKMHCIDERVTIHDFRIVPGETHTNVLFDAVLPYEVKLSEREAKTEIARLVKTIDPNYVVVVHIDRSYV